MEMPRVLIDAERLRQPNSGLGQVAFNLGKEFLAHPSATWRPVFLIPENRLGVFGQPIDHEIPSLRRRYAPRLAPQYDLWHVLHQDASYLPHPGTPYVLTIHDLNFLEEKSASKASKRLAKVQQLVGKASAVTVISQFTKRIVERHLEFRDVPISVIYNGLCIAHDDDGTRPGYVPGGEFLFTLGVVRRKKNFHVLVDLLSRLDGLNLVIAGNTKGSYAGEIRARARDLGIEERVVMAGEVEESHKVWLFRNCKAFVFPSLYEGFGLPLLESMSFGKPTFCAARSSLPEIGGDDVVYWDDFDVDRMVDVYDRGMRDFSEDPGRLERLKDRAGKFSWMNAARQYGQLYERLLSARRAAGNPGVAG